MTVFHSLLVREVRRETAECVSLAFAVPGELADAFRFTAGQYLTLRATIGGEECRRSYSICAGPDDGELRVAIKRLDGGAFSAWANNSVRPGDRMEAMPPDGRFVLPPAAMGASRTLLFFAAGSGITPVLSMIRTALGREPDTRVFLFYGNRTTAGIMFREQLEDLKDRHLTRLSVFHLLSREQQDVPALNGRLDAATARRLMQRLVPPVVDHAFVCGPFDMIDGLERALLETLPRERVHVERFTPVPGALRRPPPARADARPRALVTVIVEGRRTAIPAMEGETVIEAGERAGLDLPYSCKGGMCSTCRARVLEGTVEMAVNYSLEPWEMEGGFVLACQAVPQTERVVVDFDQM